MAEQVFSCFEGKSCYQKWDNRCTKFEEEPKSAEEFKDEILSLDYDNQKAKYGERFDKVYQLANSLKEDDNPVLIIAKK